MDRFNPSSDDPLIPPVILHNAKSTFCLNRAVHSEQCSMYALQVVYDFLMHGCKFMIDTDRAVLFRLLASLCIWASGTILTLIHFFLPAILISIYMFTILKMERLTIRAAHDSVLTDLEIDSTERILMILLIRRFLLEHRELHIFLHAVLLTEDVVVIGSVTGICNRILRVETIDVPKSIHQRNKAVHVCTILVYVNNCYIFICNSDLDVVCRKQLVISHVVSFIRMNVAA